MTERGDLGNRLYEACFHGSVAELDALIEKDELILDRANSFACFFSDTPLHVAALRGHLNITKALLSRKPKLATELDSKRCSPLHLASTEGHDEIVRELLRVNTDVCLARDQDGRIPLHLAAIKGRVEVIQELLRVKPESIREKLDREETVLHLCVKCNRLEALKTLVEDLHDNEFLSSGDDDGNTILHLAASLKQVDTVKYLLGRENVKEHCVNIKNRNNFTALDVVDHCPDRDLKSKEIEEFLLRAGVQRSEDHCHCVCKVLKKIGQCIAWFWTTYVAVDHLWSKEVRGHLITAATLTATMAYQAILSPPGGFWQEDKPENISGEAAPPAQLSRNDNNISLQKAGEAILDSKQSNITGVFLGLNSVVLFASLCTIMLALSGFPYTNKLLVWLMIFTVYITLSCLAAAYALALITLFPKYVADYSGVFYGLLFAWVATIGFVLVLHACHFFVWLVKRLIKVIRCLVCLVKKFAELVGRCFCGRKRGQSEPNNHIPQNQSTPSNCCIGNFC